MQGNGFSKGLKFSWREEMKPQDPQLKFIFTWDINKIQRDDNKIIAL